MTTKTTIRTPRGTFEAVTFPSEEAARSAGFGLYFTNDDGTDIFTKSDAETYHTEFAIIKAPEILYLPAESYNMERVLQRIADMVTKRGGKVWASVENGVMINGTIIDKQAELTESLEKAMAYKKFKYADLLQTKISNLPENKPVQRSFSSWCGHSISFLLDGDYYYLTMDDNLLFPKHFEKKKVIEKDGGLFIDGISYFGEIGSIIYNFIFDIRASDEQITMQAELILELLEAARYTENYKPGIRELKTGSNVWAVGKGAF